MGFHRSRVSAEPQLPYVGVDEEQEGFLFDLFKNRVKLGVARHIGHVVEQLCDPRVRVANQVAFVVQERVFFPRCGAEGGGKYLKMVLWVSFHFLPEEDPSAPQVIGS